MENEFLKRDVPPTPEKAEEVPSQEFKDEFRRLFKEWSGKWISTPHDIQYGPLPETAASALNALNAEEFAARDKLVEYTAEYIAKNKLHIKEIIGQLFNLFSEGFHNPSISEREYTKFIQKVFELTVSRISNNEK